MEIDIEKLRRDLIDYYGTAMSYNPVAMVELTKIEKASGEELIKIAQKNKIDISKYIVNSYGRSR